MLYWSLKAHRGRELGSVSELLCSSGRFPMLAGTVRFRGAVPRPFWLLHKHVLVLGGRGLTGQGLAVTVHWNWRVGRAGKGHTGDESCPKPSFIEGWGLKMESKRVPSAPVKKGEQK